MYQLGLQYLRRLLESGDGLSFYRQGLTEEFFRGSEVPVYAVVRAHFDKYKVLPSLQTFAATFPELPGVVAPEPLQYYADLLYNRFAYDTFNTHNQESQTILVKDKNNVDAALDLMEGTVRKLRMAKLSRSVIDVAAHAPLMVATQYKAQQTGSIISCPFGWEYLDHMSGGMVDGDIVSIIGRPASGKTWLVLYLALQSWLVGKRVLFVSMEMGGLAIAQRIMSMYAGVPYQQLKMAQFSTPTMKHFKDKVLQIGGQAGKFFVMEGRLAASPEDVYGLASVLDVDLICIDGAYLLGNRNKRLDRYQRVADNVETMKRLTEDIPTLASWQFARTPGGKEADGKKAKKRGGLENIAYSDAIGQVSSIVLALNQEESPETLNERLVEVLKGRSGEVGEFRINWLFHTMNFIQVTDKKPTDQLEYI